MIIIINMGCIVGIPEMKAHLSCYPLIVLVLPTQYIPQFGTGCKPLESIHFPPVLENTGVKLHVAR